MIKNLLTLFHFKIQKHCKIYIETFISHAFGKNKIFKSNIENEKAIYIVISITWRCLNIPAPETDETPERADIYRVAFCKTRSDLSQIPAPETEIQEMWYLNGSGVKNTACCRNTSSFAKPNSVRSTVVIPLCKIDIEI